MSLKASRSLVFATLTAALLGACYDMPLIPDDSPSLAGSAGHGNAGGAPASAGASHAGGGAKPSGGANTGGANAGGASAGSGGKSGETAGTAGRAGSSGALQITWLQLRDSTAPSSFATNAELGIEGVFYAYGDGCSTLNWDDAGRCASGKLCPPEDPDNWGISIGFDFRNTGPNSIPSNAKLTWNPNDFKARGIAWQIHGEAPKLQVWVLNMDESWNGQCTGMPCEINGPPDGVAPAALNGELHFDDMIKDTWGSGTEYTFDPAAVHALQFKIAAVKVGTASFDFCIDELGIIHE